MDLLRIEHEDFTLTVESTQFQRMWDKGVSILGGEKLISSYRWSEGVEHVLLVQNDTKREIAKDIADEAVFFEQTDYSVWVDFKKKVAKAWFDSPRKDVNDRFPWKESKQLLAGYLNYGNEIGRADMPIRYTVDGVQKRFVFSYDVVSAKLDYHSDWKKILEDIEAEYRMLSLDYLKRTYHGIKEEQGESYDIIWWNIFGGLQEQFLRTIHNIINRPRHRLKSIETYKRADQIRRLTPQLEQQLAEHRTEEARLYRVEVQQNTYNTPENRFLKHALLTVQKRYAALAERVLIQDTRMADTYKKRIKETRNELNRLSRHPFFRTVGPFDGIKQESLILQKDVNYSKVFRIFTILKKSFSLNDGLYRMETKDIATLYEIWCFIQVEKVVKELTGAEPEQHSRTEMSGLFTYSLGKGEHSTIIFKKDDVTLAELVYNPRHSDKDDVKGIGELESKTVPQKPDIVLQLTKDDLQQGMKLTYLFDAKYRLEKDGANDVPPDDAINQMHRYRDAIYYNSKHHDEKIKKEVIGGYILFPGHMDDTSRFRRSIDEVNIGAFPMRPGDNQHKLLTDFIRELLNKHAVEIVEQVIPQKGTTLEVKNRVLIGVVKPDNPQYTDFLNGTATSYYSGDTFPTTIPLDGIDYFAPYIPDKGIRDMYLVTSIHTSTRVKGAEDDKLRITFDLNFARLLFSEYRIVPLPIQHTFNDTTLDILTAE
jgi:hypothetical protein